jgi:hypothetical protein
VQADDHELARQALESGQVLPLATVLGKLEREVPGQVLKVEFEREDGRFIYEIRLLQNDGRVAKLKVDAVDGRVLAIKRKDTEKDRDANSRGGRRTHPARAADAGHCRRRPHGGGAADGREAQYLGEVETFDAVVLDLGLPVRTACRCCAAGAPPGATCRC